MSKKSMIAKFSIVSLLLGVISGCAADPEDPVPAGGKVTTETSTAPATDSAEHTGQTQQGMLAAPDDGTCGQSCSVRCSSGSCSAGAGRGGTVCCYCSSDGQPNCG